MNLCSGRHRNGYFPFGGEKTCPYCGKVFIPKFRRQVTCGYYACRRKAVRDGARPVHIRPRMIECLPEVDL